MPAQVARFPQVGSKPQEHGPGVCQWIRNQRDDDMDTEPIGSICSNKLTYYSVHHLSYVFSLLAGKPKFGSYSTEVLLGQRRPERET